MCRCCQSCFEDCYWYCIEERFCFDKNIANFNADEDEYLTKRNGKSFNEINSDTIDRPICEQPGRQDNVLSSKIREEDYRQIRTNVPFLAPEILAVFANSQIFHDNQPSKSLAIVHKSPSIHDETKKHTHNDSESEKKLLKRLEGIDARPNDETDIGQHGNDKAKNKEIVLRPIPIIRIPATASSDSVNVSHANDETDDDAEHIEATIKTPILNKRLRNIQSMPYFPCRPSSETDIFTISGNSTNQISMTPEIPSISYSALPKHYEDTPTIEKYKESVSLYSIQTSNRDLGFDFAMPRYYGKGDMIAQSVDNLASAKMPPSQSSPPKKVEKSKRLKLIRANLQPLSIHINKEKSGERNIE